jgi:hypothetical protein
MGLWIGIILGVLVCGFVFIMWGHKNTEKTTGARVWLQTKIKSVGSWIRGLFD